MQNSVSKLDKLLEVMKQWCGRASNSDSADLPIHLLSLISSGGVTDIWINVHSDLHVHTLLTLKWSEVGTKYLVVNVGSYLHVHTLFYSRLNGVRYIFGYLCALSSTHT